MNGDAIVFVELGKICGRLEREVERQDHQISVMAAEIAELRKQIAELSQKLEQADEKRTAPALVRDVA